MEASDLDRRTFLAQLAAVAGVAVLPGCAEDPPGLTLEKRPFPFSFDPPYMRASEEEIVREIEETLGFLHLDHDGVVAFARDLVGFRKSGDLKANPFLHPPQRFLLSSNFFDDGADETKTVEYLTFHDPYITPCSNRLAEPPPEA